MWCVSMYVVLCALCSGQCEMHTFYFIINGCEVTCHTIFIRLIYYLISLVVREESVGWNRVTSVMHDDMSKGNELSAALLVAVSYRHRTPLYISACTFVALAYEE